MSIKVKHKWNMYLSITLAVLRISIIALQPRIASGALLESRLHGHHRHPRGPAVVEAIRTVTESPEVRPYTSVAAPPLSGSPHILPGSSMAVQKTVNTPDIMPDNSIYGPGIDGNPSVIPHHRSVGPSTEGKPSIILESSVAAPIDTGSAPMILESSIAPLTRTGSPPMVTPPPESPILCTANATVRKARILIPPSKAKLTCQVYLNSLLASTVIKYGLPRFYNHARAGSPTEWITTVSLLSPVLPLTKQETTNWRFLRSVSPTIYAVIEKLIVTMSGNSELSGYGPLTVSFDPADMSTIDGDGDGSTKSFNFADFPCPPSAVNLNGQQYQPWVVPPPTFLDQMRRDFVGFTGDDCNVPLWFDPPKVLISQSSVNGPRLPSQHTPPQRHRRVPDLPLETAGTPVKREQH